MEITPERVLLVDRLHKQYVEVSFEALSSLANTELDFHILQSLFLNELFLPGKPQLAVTDAVHFHITPAAGRALLETKVGKGLDLSVLDYCRRGVVGADQYRVKGDRLFDGLAVY